MRQTAGISTSKLVIILVRAYRSLAEFLEGGLALQGIIPTDFMILEALLHKGPLTMSAMRQKVPSANAPIQRIIDRLKRRGLVRGQELSELTEEGRQFISWIYARHEKDIEAIMGVLSPREQSYLAQALKKIGKRGERSQHARSKDRRGGLAPWQLRRATEYMTEHLAEPVPLRILAELTELSPSRFGRAFKVSMTISPHKWRMNLRIAEAQEMLKEGELSQAEIALATGFSEQSHFSRVYKDIVRVTPGVWQRDHRP